MGEDGRQVDPTSGDSPARVYAIVKRADSAASTRSPVSARLKPAPAAVPLTATISVACMRISVETVACRLSASFLISSPTASP